MKNLLHLLQPTNHQSLLPRTPPIKLKQRVIHNPSPFCYPCPSTWWRNHTNIIFFPLSIHFPEPSSDRTGMTNWISYMFRVIGSLNPHSSYTWASKLISNSPFSRSINRFSWIVILFRRNTEWHRAQLTDAFPNPTFDFESISNW